MALFRNNRRRDCKTAQVPGRLLVPLGDVHTSALESVEPCRKIDEIRLVAKTSEACCCGLWGSRSNPSRRGLPVSAWWGVRHSRSPLKTTSRLAATPTANSKAGKTVRGVACASRPSQYHSVVATYPIGTFGHLLYTFFTCVPCVGASQRFETCRPFWCRCVPFWP